jgi:uncharacterized protein (TIGR00297 family)
MRGSAALISYFATSSLLGRLPGAETAPQQRGNRRDAVQVLANGGVPSLLALAAATSERNRPLVLTAFAGAVAAAAADTWATEIGTRYGGAPRSLLTMRPLSPGASGGVTSTGLAAAIAGSLLVALVATARRPSRSMVEPALAIVIGGIAGSLVDSLLGAAVQEVRYCPACNAETELAVHGCNTPTQYLRGAPWCNNDAVNAMSIAVGAALTVTARQGIGRLSRASPRA